MDTVVILAKSPVPGRVKTRLAARVAPEESAALARAFLVDLVNALRESSRGEVVVALPPGDPEAPVRQALGDSVRITGQGPGSLGQRLVRVMDEALSAGADVVTVIGSDHPNLPPELLSRCGDAARRGIVGWITTEDGGFAAMSLAAPFPELFLEIPWSTPRVAESVRRNAARAGIALEECGTWYDVDTPGDLARLAGDLESSGSCPATRAVLAGLAIGDGS